jgi:hypothetical protein
VQNVKQPSGELHELGFGKFGGHSPVSTFPLIAVTGAILRSAVMISGSPMSPP